jgi:hypothetical protein
MLDHEPSGHVVEPGQSPEEGFGLLVGFLGRRHAPSVGLPQTLTAALPLEIKRGVNRRPVEPTGEGVLIANRVDLAGDFEEDLLAGVLGVLRVSKDIQADAVDAILVALKEPGEGPPPGLAFILKEEIRRRSHQILKELGATEYDLLTQI